MQSPKTHQAWAAIKARVMNQKEYFATFNYSPLDSICGQGILKLVGGCLVLGAGLNKFKIQSAKGKVPMGNPVYAEASAGRQVAHPTKMS